MRRKGSSCIFIYVFYSFILETHLLELNIEYEWGEVDGGGGGRRINMI